MREFTRVDRLSAQILRSLAQILERELAELNCGMTTFTEVKLSRDLRYARVYYSFLGEEEGRARIYAHLTRHTARIRRALGHELHVRRIPELTFTYDVSIERGQRIEELLNEIKRESHD